MNLSVNCKRHTRRSLGSRAVSLLFAVAGAFGCGGDLWADKIQLVAGGGLSALPATASGAALHEPFGTEFDESGNLWIVEMISSNRLLSLNTDGILRHVAGRNGPGFSGDEGPALEAQFNGPHNLAVLPSGRILVADTWNGRIREVDSTTGTVRSLPGFEVSRERAKGSGPYCITLDDAKTHLFIADLKQVWVLDLQTSALKLVAGNGKKGVPTDGNQATNQPLSDPRAVAPDHLGNVYILERGGNALRVVDVEGNIRTVVNASGRVGNQGDGGPALDATMNGPKHLCVDRDNTVLIADAENHLVRRYVPSTGRIERVAGTGTKGFRGLGSSPEECDLARPHGVSIHPKTGELYITDSYNDRLLKIVKTSQ